MHKVLLCCLLSIGCCALGLAQTPSFSPVYLDTSVATIRITIHPDSLALIYLRDSVESDHEYPAEFTFDNGIIQDSVSMIGFRLRGNTSRSAKKKSFKVSFNTFVSGRAFHGFEKLNLNGEHNDPSIVRSKVCWDLFNTFGVAGSRANHARVFINNRYFGLYISVEHIDENFVLSRFGNNGGNLYKCLWPADLTYRGSSASNYDSYYLASEGRFVYELETNKDRWDYSDLAGFITFLNKSADSTFAKEIETRLNVPGFLKTLAIDVAVGMWDDYWYNKNNFYLYHNTSTGRFEFIPYDYDNTFGISWGLDWGNRDVEQWGATSESRPLVQRLLANQRFKRWYLFYLDRLLKKHFGPDALTARINALHTMITPAAEADSFRRLDYGYTINQFHASYDAALGAHVRYGIFPYIFTRRTSALLQFTPSDISPIIERQSYSLKGTDSLQITATVLDDSTSLSVDALIYSNGALTNAVKLHDDGLHDDGGANDGVFGGTIARPSTHVSLTYALRAEDATGNVSLDPSNAPTTLWQVPAAFTAGPLVINEFMASNSSTIADPAGEHDDWIEIMNISSNPISLHGRYLTDNLSRPDKWALPDTMLMSGGVLLIWADGQPEQGGTHAPFKLDKTAESVGIFDSTVAGFVAMDSLTYGVQENDVSIGRWPDGTGAFVAMHHPTPGAPNALTGVQRSDEPLPNRTMLMEAYPNPFNPTTRIGYRVSGLGSRVKLAVYDMLGREVAVLVDGNVEPGTYEVAFDGTRLASGLYLCRMTAGNFTQSKKIIFVR
jgi:hypothetical protein